jgi:hypothetical protein
MAQHLTQTGPFFPFPKITVLHVRPLIWGDGTKWGDPNARWGSPSYVLEPGDPGYVPVPPDPPQNPTPKPRNMKNNPTPKNLKVLLSLAQDIADGLHAIEDTIGMKQNKEADVRADIKALEGDPAAPDGSNAKKGSILVYQQTQTATTNAEGALSDLAGGDVQEFLQASSDVLSGILGRKWSNGWIPTGFPDHSTAVPRSQDKKFALLNNLKNYFTANPTHELNQPPHQIVTAARANTLHEGMSDLRTAINTAAATQEIAKNQRDADADALFARVSGTIAEVDQVLPDDSPQWETLGLNIPAHPNPPEAVGDLTLTGAGPKRLSAEWPPARRATYFRVFILVVGTDTEFRHYDNTDGVEILLKDLPSGATVKVKVKAANAGGEAPDFSPEKEAVVP